MIEDSGALTKQVNRSLLDILGGGRAGNGGDGGSGGDGAGNDQGFDGGKLEIHQKLLGIDFLDRETDYWQICVNIIQI